MPKKTCTRETKKMSAESSYWRADPAVEKGARICRTSPKRARRMRSLSLVALRLADSPSREDRTTEHDQRHQHRNQPTDRRFSLQPTARREGHLNRHQEAENLQPSGVRNEDLKINCNRARSLRLTITKEAKCILTPIRTNSGNQEQPVNVEPAPRGDSWKRIAAKDSKFEDEGVKRERKTKETGDQDPPAQSKDETKDHSISQKDEDPEDGSETSDRLLERSDSSSLDGLGLAKERPVVTPPFLLAGKGMPDLDGAPLDDTILPELDPDFLGSLLASRGRLEDVPPPGPDNASAEHANHHRSCAKQCLKSSANMMFTDTNKYTFKSAFKDLNESMRQFDEYSGLTVTASPNSQQQLNQQQMYRARNLFPQGFDIMEAYADEVKKRFYRKKLVNESLDSWYRYNYEKWLEAYKMDDGDNGDDDIDVPWVLTASQDASTKLAESIWKMNARFKPMEIPSLQEILDTDIESVRSALLEESLFSELEENPANVALLEVSPTPELDNPAECSSSLRMFFNRTFEPSEFLGSSTPNRETDQCP